tara:strand:+ start:210 stop:2075 length:1866 start_codon:yes stop_codon:yes gene_type:complete
MSDALKKFQDQLITRGLGTGLPFFPGLPSLDSAGLRFDPPKRKIGEISQGILSALEKGAKLTDKALTYPAELGESAVEYLLSPSEIAKQQAQEKRDSITKSLSLDELFYPSGNFREDERKIAEAQGMRFDPVDLTEKIRDLSPSGPKADQLVIDAEENKNQRDKTQKEAITSLAQLNQEVAEDEMGRKPPSGAVVEDAFSSAMQDYIEQARGAGPETKELSLDDYKKEFAEATGIDISGKVDKSSALMAFGLALMQNRAGKGFNVGRMLSSVGKAGEVALPALEKAKTQARNDAIAAGKYALETRASDRAIDASNQEKLMDRGKYWVYKKGGKGAEFSQFDKGEFVNLNKFELNKLINNPEFDKNYEFINAEKRFDILKARAEALDKDPDKSWSSKGYERISLIGGDPKETPFELTVQGVTRDANYELKPGEYNMKLGETKESVIDRMIGYQKDINKDSKMFGDLLKFINDGGVSIPAQIVSRVKQFARSLGFNEGKATDPASARRLLQNIAIDEATRILQESGKTLSDTDRQLVQKRVSDINFTLEGSDPAIIKRQIQDVYDLVVTKAQDNLDQSIRALGRDFGVFVYPAGQDDIPESQEELDAMNKKYNTNLTMDDYKK